jgi:hypothetical protein
VDVSPIIVDIETCGLPNAADYLEPCQPDKRLKDADKIKADIAEKEQARLEKLALDWNVGRIAALAWWTEEQGTAVRICQDDYAEKWALGEFWRESKHRTIVGFNIKGFDLRFMVQRSRYLGVPYPMLDFSKYSRRGISDLYLDLTFGDGTYDQGAMRRTLKAFAKRFGIPVDDIVNGAEIPALVAAGDWDQVEAHVTSDVMLTVALAQKLGVVNASVPTNLVA